MSRPGRLSFRFHDFVPIFTGSMDHVFPTVVGRLYFTKAWDWSTESEYRFLVHGEADDYEYLKIEPTRYWEILCRSRLAQARLADLAARCPELMAAGRIFHVQWRNGFPVPIPVKRGWPSAVVRLGTPAAAR